MKKVVVIGCPGSGKSHVSRALHKITGLPLYHLDMIYWNSDGTKVDRTVFLENLGALLERDEWIIDGNYSSTMELCVAACDTVLFLDYPTEVCLEGIESRRGKARDDIPWVETELNPDFITFVKNYRIEQRPEVLKLLEKYSDKRVVVLKSRDEATALLDFGIR